MSEARNLEKQESLSGVLTQSEGVEGTPSEVGNAQETIRAGVQAINTDSCLSNEAYRVLAEIVGRASTSLPGNDEARQQELLAAAELLLDDAA